MNAQARIVRTGLRLLDRVGWERFSLRRLAAALGMTPMALYHYYPNKDALLDAILAEALSELRAPRRGAGGWAADVRRLVLGFRRLLGRHPHIVPVLMSRPALSPAALRWYDAALSLLRSGGLNEKSAARGYAALYAYTLGFAAIEGVRASAPSGARVRRSIRGHLEGLPPESVATLAEIAPRVGRFDQSHFEFGLDLLIVGLQARVARGGAASRRRR